MWRSASSAGYICRFSLWDTSHPLTAEEVASVVESFAAATSAEAKSYLCERAQIVDGLAARLATAGR